jgi:hypothetical protein
MNLYRVIIKRNYVKGFQLDKESYLVIALGIDNANEIVSSKLKANRENFNIISTSRVPDGTYIINDTYITNTEL